MTKALVDNRSGAIRGVYATPLDFSIDGHFVVDVPDDLGLDVASSTLSTLLTDKSAAMVAKYPGTVAIQSDEFATTAKIDPTLSSLISAAPGKRTVIYPGGTLITTSMTLSPNPVTTARVRWSCAPLVRIPDTSSTPSPARLLFGYDTSTSAYNYSPTMLTTSIMDSAGTGVVSSGVAFGASVSVSGSPLVCRLRFVNTLTVPVNLTDWYLLST